EPELDDRGQPTGYFLVDAGERRRQALKLLVRQKRMPRHARILCTLKRLGSGREVSLAENVVRVPMHPADQVEAFARLHTAEGLGVDDIAARFGLTPAVVRQRLRLAALAPALLALYRTDEITTEQAQALALTDDHAAQRRTWDTLGWNKDADVIRRLLTGGTVAASDRRARLVGLAAYEAAGGTVLRDLFSEAGECWLADAALLDRLCRDRLGAVAAEVRQEGWAWVEVHPEFPYGHAHAMRRLVPRSPADDGRIKALSDHHDRLLAEHGETPPEPVLAEMQETLTRITALLAEQARQPACFDPEDRARAGAIVALAPDGTVRVERGYVRPGDEPAAPEPVPAAPSGDGEGTGSDAPRPLSERLVMELTGHRTAALAAALAARSDVALRAVTHALALGLLYGSARASCLLIDADERPLHPIVPDLDESRAGRELAGHRERWRTALPQDAAALWAWLRGQHPATVQDLLAYCAALTVDAVPLGTPASGAATPADLLAGALDLDMADWWRPTVDGYFGRVSKARILDAVADVTGPREARHLSGLKKAALAIRAASLVAGSRWLPPLLRRAGAGQPGAADAAAG
ncbi:MAG TPA: ParB/RepB/Spo0J family partition protein, partial [Azospirillaceae bacterium]|nr:ParB/RepB/Spo0J family partition protein [Azospirillaceae bacterium]